MRGVVYGKGINDSDRAVTKIMPNGSKWICPKYEMWKGMLRRCLDVKFKAKHTRYLGCEVSDEWLSFKNFESWVGDMSLDNLELDKDIRVSGNKVYSPKTCFLVPSRVNTLMLSTKASKGLLPTGVHAKSSRYYSQISDQFNNKQRYLGYYDDSLSAHRAWQSAKIDHIRNTVNWWFTSDMNSSYNQECADRLEEIAQGIELDWINKRETILE